MLQADSEKLRQAWVQAVQASIASAYRESPDSCYSEVGPPCTCVYSSHRPHTSTHEHSLYAHMSVCAHMSQTRACVGVCAHTRLQSPAPEPSGTAHEACAQVGEVRMTGEQGCQTRQLAGLSQLPTPLCLLSSWARSLSSLLHTRRTVIVLHTVVERIKSENL